MQYFLDFRSVEPLLVPTIFENMLEIKSKLSGNIVGHVYRKNKNMSGYHDFSTTDKDS